MTRTLLALSIALATLVGPPHEGPRDALPAPPEESFDRYHQGIFFAVLEGLYRDGVSSAAARAIVELDPLSGYPLSFVQGCPICTPAMDAFQLYLARPAFYARKVPADTFGQGLSEEVVARLTGPDRTARRAALRELVEGWVDGWLDRQRLDPGERDRWRAALSERSKRGMDMLAELQQTGLGLYGDFDECPLCLGAEAGSAR